MEGDVISDENDCMPGLPRSPFRTTCKLSICVMTTMLQVMCMRSRSCQFRKMILCHLDERRRGCMPLS